MVSDKWGVLFVGWWLKKKFKNFFGVKIVVVGWIWKKVVYLFCVGELA